MQIKRMSRGCLFAAALALSINDLYGAGAKKNFWATIAAPAFLSAENTWTDSLMEVMSTEQKTAARVQP